MKLTEKQAKKLSKKLSVMKSEMVQFNYEYWVDPSDPANGGADASQANL